MVCSRTTYGGTDPGQARRAARGGLQSGEGRSGRRRRRQPVVAQALLPHVLPLRRVVHHAALHRERHLERPGPGKKKAPPLRATDRSRALHCVYGLSGTPTGEGDDGGPGRRPDGAPGASLQAQQQADAAEERPRRPGLPQRVHQQEDGAVAVPCPAPYVAWSLATTPRPLGYLSVVSRRSLCVLLHSWWFVSLVTGHVAAGFGALGTECSSVGLWV